MDPSKQPYYTFQEPLLPTNLVTKTPVPKNLVIETPVPQTLVPKNLVINAPVPETLVPKNLVTDALVPKNLVTDAVVPKNLAIRTPVPENLVPKNLVSQPRDSISKYSQTTKLNTLEPHSCPANPGTVTNPTATTSRDPKLLQKLGPTASFTVPVQLQPFPKVKPSPTTALIDCGATSCFIDKQLANQLQVPLRNHEHPLELQVVDGRPIQSGPVTQYTAPMKLTLGKHQEDISLNVTSLPNNPVVLGLPWLEVHNPAIDWPSHRINLPDTTSALGSTAPQIPSSSNLPAPKVAFINAAAFSRIARKNHVYTLHLKSTDLGSNRTPVQSPPHLPEKYKDFADVFEKKKAEILPEHRPYDCAIELEDDKVPPFGPIYGLTEDESKTLYEYLQDNLKTEFIRHSTSPAGAPILFVKKKDGSLRLCVDYRGLNRITKKNRYPLPLIPSLLDQLRTAKRFTKIDLRGAYNLIRIKEGDEWKTAFRTRYGHFEYRVMPFGLTNAPAVFQHLMNDIFRDYLDQFVIIYLDDILIFSANPDDHDHHVRLVLQRLRQHGLYAKLEKCEFDVNTVEFLGYIISTEGISMDPKKIETVLNWATPANVTDVQRFLGFANFYRRFIRNYSKITTPLTALTRKQHKFDWSPSADAAFTTLKTAFTSAPILLHPQLDQPFIVETDASDFALGAVLSQRDNDGILHPIAYHSRKFSTAEINYEIYDKELLAIIDSFQTWRQYLLGAQHKITVYCDHKNLEYFMTTRVLNRRQARWSMFLSDFDFEITYRPGTAQGKPDALSRRREFEPKEGDEAHRLQQQTLLRHEHLKLSALQPKMFMLSDDKSFLDDIRTATTNDPYAINIISQLASAKHPKPPAFSTTDGLLLHQNLVYVPPGSLRLKVTQSCHDSPLSGHFGFGKTLELINRNYWWPQQWKMVKHFIRTCNTCARTKSNRHKPYGLLEPLPVPNRPWDSISMDFIVELPEVNGKNAILVVVDRFTKMASFIPCHNTIDANGTAQLFLDYVVCHHGLPTNIVSDRGSIFVSKFWKQLMHLLGIKISLSTAYHPQTDGQTERVNQVLEQYLRCFVNYEQTNWITLLPLAQFAYNNTLHSSTQTTPFFANQGWHPRFEINSPTHPVNPAAEARAQELSELHKDLAALLKQAQKQQKNHADRFRIVAPEFSVGDQVWLLRRNIKTTRPCDKLDYRKLGPFKIIAQVNPVAFRLELPAHYHIHPVFHVSLLEKYHPSTIPGRLPDPPPPVEVQSQQEWEVERILDSFIKRRRFYYLVAWKGYPESEATAEPAEHLAHAQDLVEEFHHQHPDKPRPKTRTPPGSRR